MTAQTCARACRLLAVLAAACSLLSIAAAPAGAWPGNDKDPCAHAAPADQVDAINGIRNRNARGEEGVWTIRACSPVLRLGGSSIATPTEMFNHVLPNHVMEGGASAPFISRGRLKLFPYLLGPEGTAVRYQALLGSEILRDALIGAGIGFTSGLVMGVVTCLAGLLPTGGIACGAIPAGAISGIGSAIFGVVQGVIGNQLERVSAMASSAWDFHVPSGWKGFIVWNGFGTVGHNYIDPSFTNLWPSETPPFHMWAWFSAYPVGQGPNPDGLGTGASAPQAVGRGGPITGADVNPKRLLTSRGEINRRGPDLITEIAASGRRIHRKQGANVIVATGAHDDLIGGGSEDVLAALAPFDRVWGGRGNDVLLAAGRGDRLVAGPGDQELEAAGRGDVLYAGAGRDTLVSEKGNATLYASRTTDVDVHNGRGNDTVVCPRVNRDIVIADRGDRVSRSCKYVFVNGRGAPPSPAMVGRRGFNGSHRGTRPIGP